MSPFLPRVRLLPGWLLLGAAAQIAAAGPQVMDLRPLWDAEAPLANPHKGWYHHYPDNHIDKYKIARDEDLLLFPGMDHVYLRLAWSYLEPEEGRFHWAVIDPIIEKWTRKGLGIAFRITCRETGVDIVQQQFATPRWVIAAGAKGGHYRARQATGPEGPWEPVYDDPVFLAKLDRFLAAFAGRYDGKPGLRYVDIGSIGDWGEGHTVAGSGRECGFDARRAHVDLHLKHFRHTQLVVSDDFVFALQDPAERLALHRHIVGHRISYRDDSILVGGYLAKLASQCTVRSPEFFAEAYPATPTVLELEHYGTVKKQGNWDGTPNSLLARYGNGRTGPDLLRGALELLHASYLGYHGYAHQWLADNPRLTVELLNRCGYWFFPHEVSLPDGLRRGRRNLVAIKWENRGVAPAYHPYRLRLRLQGPETVDFDLEAGNRRWLPSPGGECHAESYSVDLAAAVTAGAYDLKLKLFSEEARRDVRVALAPRLLDADGYFRIGTVQLP